ncbi:efflux RND transporter periplasmic adaptor subunit [Mucilaginibacter koreensis]
MKNNYTLLTAAAVLMLAASCKNKDQANAAPPPTPVTITPAIKGDAVYYDQYQGTVVAYNSVELRSQVAGFITGIFFKEGDVVKKGQQLYEIDRRKYEAAYAQAQANLASAQANLVKAQKDADRYQFLLKNDAVARQTYDQAVATLATSRAQVQVARAGVKSAATDLSYSIIRAPFTGRIGISQVKLGAEVTQGTTLLNTLSNENPIATDIVVNQADIERFGRLQRNYTDSTFRLQLSTGEMYHRPGKILAIDRGVNNQTGTIKVRIQFQNPDDELKDGMSAVVNVLNGQSGEQVIIPYKAVTEQMGEFFVYVAPQDTVAYQRKITLGPRLNANVVVLKGLEAGDKVISEGFQKLRDSAKVTTKAPQQQAAGSQAGGAGSAGQGKPQNTQGK